MIDNRLINKQNIKRLTYSDISNIKKVLKRNMHSEVSNKATMVESSSNLLPYILNIERQGRNLSIARS